jgi:hypothetical protein
VTRAGHLSGTLDHLYRVWAQRDIFADPTTGEVPSRYWLSRECWHEAIVANAWLCVKKLKRVIKMFVELDFTFQKGLRTATTNA